MYKKKWQDLRKLDDLFVLEPEATNKTQSSARVHFTHLAFDCDDECLVATDSIGHLYYVDLWNEPPSYQRLANVGQTTFIAFNPMNKHEILMGSVTANIKILRINEHVSQYCLLMAHKVPPVHVSFYEKYCLTYSSKEVIIWCLHSYSKAQQLKVCTKNVVKKASFSSLGQIVVLYDNDSLQAWNFNQLGNDVKIDARTYGLRNIKDFVFIGNGTEMIMSSAKNNIVILNTCNWNLLKSFTLLENITGVKQLSVIPRFIDDRDMFLACISSCTFYILDLDQSCVLYTLHPIKTVKKFAISSMFRYIACIDKEGPLKIISMKKVRVRECKPIKKLKEPCRPIAHGIHDHIKYVEQRIEQELRLERLIRILKEFGEYSNIDRKLIWLFILKLPGNKCAYSALTNKAANSNFTSELLKNYSLASRSQKTLLTTTINCLIQWCPLLLQCTFLPNLVFPFLITFQKDVLLGFELILTILLSYCQKWFEYHPLPPLNVLGIIENILLHSDPSLLKFFCERGITSSEYAWPLLKTALSEVLCGPEWLILWDHLLTFQRPSLLLMSVVAYSICSRKIIMSSLNSPESIKRYFNSQGHISAKQLIKIAQQLDNNVPLRIHPSRYIRNEVIALPSDGPYPPFIIEDFPKFLTDDISILELEKLKEEERIARERNRKMMEIAEEERLKRETKAFMEQIHQARLTEVEKCIRRQLSDIDWGFKTKMQYSEAKEPICEHTCEQFYDVPQLDIDVLSDEDVINAQDKKTKQLQRDVDKLQYEVQSLLTSLRSQRSHR